MAKKKKPKFVESEEELVRYDDLEQIGPTEFYTGSWHYRDSTDRKKARRTIMSVARRHRADVVLCKDLPNKKDQHGKFDVKFYRYKSA